MAHFPKAEADVSALALSMRPDSLTNQPHDPQLEYQVKVVNVSGESVPSNTMEVVL